MNKEQLLGFTPWTELIMRRLYYSKNSIIKDTAVKLNNIISKKRHLQLTEDDSKWNNIKQYIESLNIHHRDLLIVHSSAEQLGRIGANPRVVLKFLTNLVGEEGTLIIPCFPMYDEHNFDTVRQMYVYNHKRTICTTGLIPNLFLRTKGVVRSEFPWNTLAAKGPFAEEIMSHNMETDLAHGKGSAWDNAMRHGAKILLLGVQASHTTTMVHVAEDILDEKWPIAGWYEKKSFIIKQSTDEIVKEIRIRRPEWSKYNASWYRSNQLAKYSILDERKVEGINIGFIESSEKMVKFIIERTLNHKPFFIVPKRCYKRNET